jgi:tRNA threonylcarbamoyladenosine biosynthesis protein TsaB
MRFLLAFDTSTDAMSLALAMPTRVLVRDLPGGPLASARLLPELQALMAEAGQGFEALEAIAFGRGPGAFTGLRTACSVAQGLAFGAGKPVLPLDSLMLVAEDARGQAPEVGDWWIAMDARMDEVYAGCYRWDGARWQVLAAPALYTLQALNAAWQATPPRAVAGSALAAFGDRLPAGQARVIDREASRGQALARLALQALAQGDTVDAAHALPLYVRDKVALTTEEREAAKRAKEPVA